MKVRFNILFTIALSGGLLAALAYDSGKQYAEEDVRAFVLPGTAREAIIARFGKPTYDEKNPKFADGSTKIDEIIYFDLPLRNPPVEQKGVFSGFQVRLKDGKAVDWTSAHSSVHLGR